MSIDVHWEDENGNELAAVVSPPTTKFTLLIPPTPELDYPCLRWIDHYGDTTFNQVQIAQLADDLSRLMRQCPDDETQQHLEAILALVNKAEGKTHTYIKFYGD